MEQVAGDAIKQYPLVAIPLVAIGVMFYWFLAHLRWQQESQNKQTEKLAVSFDKNTEMLGRVGMLLDRHDRRELKESKP